MDGRKIFAQVLREGTVGHYASQDGNISCSEVRFADVDYIHGSSGHEQAQQLHNYCALINSGKCDISSISGANDSNTISHLLINANCNRTIEEFVMYSATLLLVLFIIITNSFELILINKQRPLPLTNYLIASLAASDLLLGVSAIYTTVMNILTTQARASGDLIFLAEILEIRSMRSLCLSTDSPGFMYGCMLTSVLTLTAIATEKYITIFHPLDYDNLITHTSITVVIIIIWVFAQLFGFLPLIGWNEYHDEMCLFVEKSAYSYLLSWALISLTCALITTLLYGRIFIAAQQHARRIAAHDSLTPRYA